MDFSWLTTADFCCAAGDRSISQVRHFDFQYLLKADDDSFVCLTRIASMLHDLDPEIADKIYAGVPTACNQDTNPDYWVSKNPGWKKSRCNSTACCRRRRFRFAVPRDEGRALFVRSWRDMHRPFG